MSKSRRRNGVEEVISGMGQFGPDSQGKPIHYVDAGDRICKPKLAEEAFKHVADLGNLVAGISTRFINLDSAEIDEEIQHTLQSLGQFAGVDRGYVFLLSDDGKTVSNTHEWCAEGVKPEISRLQQVPVERMPWLHESMLRFEIANIPDTSQVPEAATADKVEFRRQGIRSLIAVPMVLRRALAGFVGFDSVKDIKAWPEKIVPVLQLVAQIITNAIDRKRTETKLKQSEEKYRALFDYSVDAIFLLRDGRFIDCNPQGERLFGYSRNDIIGSLPVEFSPLFQPDKTRSEDKAREMISKALTGQPQAFEWLHQRQDGTLIETEITLTAVYLGEETFVQAIMRDITDRKLAENELEISRMRLQSLANYLISVREDEKSHIARELHDELGQTLTVLNMDLKWLGGKLKKNRNLLAAKTDQMAQLVKQTIQTVKRIQGELRPTLLDNLGLIAAIEWQLKEFQERTNLDVSFTHPEEIEIDAERATALFRIFQEAQTNVVKHAEATRVEISLSETEESLELTVRDNGRGIRPEDYDKRDSFGLLGITERVSSLRGELFISSKDNVGTRLDVRIPK